eukprot:CAMPEP_0117060932 /NCGR_PEP_ID=MMETSP0472-20121206/42391_1 /TAXON_ID=693140 ORGANISM="Tiarina fusus, Strain LIS" /NCGR_SAMPLE_ID=MMETSP0472 /ASSEMBLY_ACC=CAM_ASM_000603 /LENGTH=309 /DNA_ID=CAMNT_0004779353 /DNA_START=332 /DNA_END=1264 /DNA_ORIENTATION=+
MKRNTEYCQWFEHYTETTTRHGDEEETVRTYYYTKGWYSHRIPSFLFDQPFGHNNPQRDPYPSHHWQAESASFGDYTIDSDIIHSASNFKTKIWENDQISDSYSSPATQIENFKYIGDGYFYSAYEASQMELIAKFAGQFFEGSMNIQLFDFLPQCTAGDIRVSYQSVEMNAASVIGLQKDAAGSLGGWRSSRGYLVALLEDGFHTGSGMMLIAMERYLHWTVWVARALMILWSFVILIFVMPGQSLWFYLAASAALTLTALGVIWLIVNPGLYSAILSILFFWFVTATAKRLIMEGTNARNSGIDLKK